jgi:hypothetical protein
MSFESGDIVAYKRPGCAWNVEVYHDFWEGVRVEGEEYCLIMRKADAEAILGSPINVWEDA